MGKKLSITHFMVIIIFFFSLFIFVDSYKVLAVENKNHRNNLNILKNKYNIKSTLENNKNNSVKNSKDNNLKILNNEKDYIKAKGNLVITKVDKENNNKKLMGAVFGIYKEEYKNGALREKLITEITTNKNGIAKCKLPLGNYKIKELIAPKGYLLSNETKSIVIKLENKVSPLKVKVEDYADNCNVKILGLDSKNSNIKLNGAEFKIKDLTGKYVLDSYGNPIKLTTNKYGISEVRLKSGPYKLIETKAPKGYEKLKNEVKFNILLGEENYNIIIKNNLENINIKPNYEDKRKIIVNLVDLNNKNLDGGVFDIYSKKSEKVIKTVTIPYKGVCEFFLGDGEYTISERMAPKGYLKSNEKKYFFINVGEDEDKPLEISFQNKLDLCKLEIKKVDVADINRTLKGAIFKIEKKDGTEIKELVTDKNGVASLYLKSGRYKIIEYKAPEGYEKYNGVIEIIIISGENKTKEIIVKDKKEKKEYNIENQKETIIEDNEEKPQSMVILHKKDLDSKSNIEKSKEYNLENLSKTNLKDNNYKNNYKEKTMKSHRIIKTGSSIDSIPILVIALMCMCIGVMIYRKS